MNAKKNTVLLTGGTGLLGKYILQSIPQGYYVYATYVKNTFDLTEGDAYKFRRLDVTDQEEITKQFAEIRPNVIIHTASLGNVDYCESHKDEAKAINIVGTKNMLTQAKKYNSHFIFTSSNAVYNGKNPPYTESDTVAPLDYYGYTKVQSEEDIKNEYAQYTILRLMTMYGWENPHERKNPVSWIVDELKKEQPMKIVDDIYNNYLYASDASQAVWKVITQKKTATTYNISGKECISRFELAKTVAKVFGLNASLLSPVSNDFFTTIAPRPKNTCFVIDKAREEFGYDPYTTLDGLTKMRDEKK